jgi:hypothetical protein
MRAILGAADSLRGVQARLRLLFGVAAVLLLGLMAAAVDVHLPGSADAEAPLPRADAVATVGGPQSAPAVAPGFVGLSIEFQGLGSYVAHGRNPVLEHLIASLAPAQAPVLRIGGDSSDHSWWPTSDVQHSPGLSYALTPTWAAGVSRLVHDVGARVILGLNLEADSPRLAAVEAQQLVARIGRGHIQSLELGNEPSLYGALPWYVVAGSQPVRGRSPSYSPSAYVRDFAQVARALPALPLAGPALGAADWMVALPGLVRSVPRISDITFHRYPMNRCFTRPSQPAYPTMAHMLSPAASDGLAATIAPYTRYAHRHRLSFRVAEMNSVACEGKQGISDTFGSALWALDAAFAMAAQGATGINIHTFPGARYRLFALAYVDGRWSATVAPEYYGLLAFARAAPAGSRLLRVAIKAPPTMRVWATRGGAGSATRVVLINEGGRRQVVQVNLPQAARGSAMLEELTAPKLRATSGVSLAGQRFAAGTTSGRLAGTLKLTPALPAGGGFRVAVPAGSAMLLTVDG